ARPPAPFVTLEVLRRQVGRLAAPQRRGVPRRLHAGVERVETAAGRQADRILLGERVNGRLELDGAERGRASFDWLLPQAIVEVRAARVILLRAGPRDAIQLFQPAIAHPL